MSDIKTRIIDLYNKYIVAKWYRSSSLVVGWMISAVVFLPDALDLAAQNWDFISGVALPTMSPELKALVLGLYVTFGAPALRSWRQKVITQAALVQAVESGMVTSAHGTEAVTVQVPGKDAVIIATPSVAVLAALHPDKAGVAQTKEEAMAEADQIRKANDAWTHVV